MTDDLRDCPFCGAETYMLADKLVYTKCDCLSVPFEDAGYYPEKWNTRPIEDELRAEIERLNKALDQIIAFKVYYGEGNAEQLQAIARAARSNKKESN